MYIPTYIYILKNCHQHSYRLQNFMSSWGLWSKISKLLQVGDVSFFRSKSSLFIFTNTWESFFCECKENGVYGWMVWMGWDGVSKVSFNFVYTL